MSGKRLEGKVAIVTGAASGFGKAIATRFAEEGCRVLVADLNGEGAEAAAKDLKVGENAVSLSMDVTKEAHWEEAVKTVVEKWGKVDICVNNAGTTYKNKPTLEVTAEDFDRVFNVNVRSIFLSVRAVVPQMQKQGNGGSIINVSSIGSTRPRPGLVWYNSSKGAVTNATKGLAAEYGPDQIRVNALAPLLSGTGLFESFAGVKDTPENRQKFLSNVPLGRLTEVTDVANTALFLASDEGKFLTGTNIEIDGGRGI